jgi:hypothetical protein
MGYYKIIESRIYVKKRSKKNNRRAVKAVKDAGTSLQPAGLALPDWRKAQKN